MQTVQTAKTDRSKPCPNCSNPRESAFCPECGQNDRDYRRALPPMVWNLLSEAFEFDGRLVRSLRLLFLQPGALSTEFSHNRRAAYISPIRMYLFASLVFFFSLSLEVDLEPPAHASVEVTENLIDDEKIAFFKASLGGEYDQKIDAILSRESGVGRDVLAGMIDSAAQSQEPPSAGNRFVAGQMIEALSDPTYTVRAMLDNAPIASLLLIPAYALLLKLLYVRQRKFYVEHLVFTLHLHTAAFLIFALAELIPDEWAYEEQVSSVLLLGYAAYQALALKGYYRQGWIKTLLKYGFLIVAYSLLMVPAVLLVMLATISFL